MADECSRFSFSTSSSFSSPQFQSNAKRVPINKKRHNSKVRPQIPSITPIIPDQTTSNHPSFKFATATSTPSPEVFTFGSKSSTTFEKPADDQQEAVQEEQFKVEPAKSSALILVSRVLKGIPQSPHFWSLRNMSDLAKKQLPEAWDRVFEESAEKIQNMKTNGFWLEAKKLWKPLEELQGMGYNVIVLRRRLIELTDVLAEKRGFKNEIVGLVNKAEIHRMEKSRLEFEIIQLKARVEAEKTRLDDLLGTAEKMEVELHGFDDVFSSLVIKPIEI